MGIRVRLCSDWCLREADILSDYPQTSVSCIVRTQYPYFAQRYAGITGFGPVVGSVSILLLCCHCLFFFLRCLVSQHAHSTYEHQSDEVSQAARYQKGKSSNDAEDSLPPLHVAEYEAA